MQKSPIAIHSTQQFDQVQGAMQANDNMLSDNLAVERLMLAIECSIKVSRRPQFFLWSQGALQGLLPHEMLICVFGDFTQFRFKYDIFSSTKIEQPFIDALLDPLDGPVNALVRHWVNGRRAPLQYPASEARPGEAAAFASLRRLGCGHVMAHGPREIVGDEGSFFVFAQMPVKPDENRLRYLDIMVPHLHMALYRMLPNESANLVVPNQERILSARELEVLSWVREGKTNQQIGDVLNISPLTVKNHVQKILRKLGVSNRLQAVSKSQAAHLLAEEYHSHRRNRAAQE